MRASSIKFVKLLLKAVFVFSALAYVLYNQNIDQILHILSQGEIRFIVYSMIFASCLIVGSGLRFRIYLENIGVKAGQVFSIILIYIGMFFNAFLPGGIGGDGYLAFYIVRYFKKKPVIAIRTMLSGRANGLFFVNIVLFILFLLSDFKKFVPFAEELVIALFIAQVIVYYFASKYILKEGLSLFFRAGGYSMLLQLFSILTSLFVLFSLGLQNNFINYLFLYFAAAVIAVLPISPGGIGIRELVFFEGAKLLGLDTEFAIAASLLYYAVFLMSSLLGLVLYLSLSKLEKKFQVKVTEE